MQTNMQNSMHLESCKILNRLKIGMRTWLVFAETVTYLLTYISIL